MMNFSLADLDATQNYYEYNNTRGSYKHNEETNHSNLGAILWPVILLTTCCIGFVGNGYIIWLLGFQIKRNCFTTFILNLAIADFGYLISVVIISINEMTVFLVNILEIICISFVDMMYINTHFLMTAISIDRCVCVLFPIWHHCSQPKHLSPVVCALLWISSFLLIGSVDIVEVTKVIVSNSLWIVRFLVAEIVCLLLITLSAGVLFIKVCLKSNQRNQGRLLLTILITLLCFLILAFPLSVFGVFISFSKSAKNDNQKVIWGICIVLFSCLNSNINPVIYFLVGRKKGAQFKENVKVILQNAFEEDEVIEELKATYNTSVLVSE